MAPLARDEIERAYREYHHSVLRRATQLLGNEQAAREAVQEVFVSLIRDPAQFRGASSIATWLYSATTHLCLNKIRDRRNEPLRVDDFGPMTSVEVGEERMENRDLARKLVLRAPEQVRTAAWLYHVDGMDQGEVAAVLGVSRRTVVSYLATFARFAKKFFSRSAA